MEIIILLLIIAFVVAIVMVPIQIAKHRGITDSELTTITILSWCGIVIGVTWLIALVLSLTYKPSNWIDKDNTDYNLNNLDALEKLSKLKEKGVISEDEFNKEKQRLLKDI